MNSSVPPPQGLAGRPRIRFVDVFGHRVRVAIWSGPEGATPLLMLNGICARIELIAPLAEAVAQGREVVSFEFPGAGESAPPRLPYTMSMAAAFTARLLRTLGYTTVDVCGVSWGGTLAQQFSIQHRRRCRKLVLAATFAGIPAIPGSPRTLRELCTPRRFNDPAHRRQIAGDLYGGKARGGGRLVDDLEHRYGRASHIGYLFQQLAVTGWSSQPCLWRLRQPTLIMAGDDDPIIPLINARWMATLIPHAILHVVPDGHLFFLADTTQTSRVISAFLDGRPHPPDGGPVPGSAFQHP
jgi:poly(3-hydroxyoctanoate) depolymerase